MISMPSRMVQSDLMLPMVSLTHFKPAWISVSIDKLRELQYTHDYLGRDLTSPDQIVELMMQDLIIPRKLQITLLI